ncbi:hypothetical protein LY625_05095 [Lysobacter sp. GX 14042]|uniref:hypothetical protein n=1 Tax=Lysobacter sp. GX 14042 TaxID=2907155 RepID=UPI001F48E4D5|nr:hypothetical protein [Lysobacter sp. GX 14042]MCE7031998.1 hypothetical protein [Lysobacter sp. GX 14042]
MNCSAIVPLILLLATAPIGCSASSAGAAASDCAHSAEFTIKAHDNDGIAIAARSCGDSTSKGIVNIETFVAGESRQTFSISYDSTAYSLDMENQIDLDGDGTPDLSVSTGTGKGGEGTFYWVRDKTRNQYHPVGDYPTLFSCESHNGILYSVTPGSGESISTWTYYKFIDQAITPLLAIEVTASTEDEFLKLTDTTYTQITIKPALASRVREDEIEGYLRRCFQLRRLFPLNLLNFRSGLDRNPVAVERRQHTPCISHENRDPVVRTRCNRMLFIA